MIIDIAQPDDPRIPLFYELYSRIFVLEEEREPVEGFRRIFGFNGDPAVQAAFGPLIEQVAVAIEPATGAALGLANYILYAYPGRPPAGGGFAGSCHINFLCVDENHRGRGVARLLLDHVEGKLRAYAAAAGDAPEPLTFITIEQNDPARMTPEQRRADLDAAGIEPERRARWWTRQGYRRLDFAYRQPPLGPGLEPCAYLNYFARVPADPDRRLAGLPAAVLAEHLRRFFFVSVGKFAFDIGSSREWLEQKDDLSRRREVAFAQAAGGGDARHA